MRAPDMPYGVADRDRPAVHVQPVMRDAQAVAAIQDLAGEGLVQFPQVDVLDLQAVLGEQLGDGEDGANAHLVRLTPRHRHAAVDAERLEAAAFGFAGFHENAGRGPVGKLGRVAGGDEAPGLDRVAIGEDGLEAVEAGQVGLGPVALVLAQGDGPAGDFAGGLVSDQHFGGHRHDFIIEGAGLLGRGGPLLGAQGVFVLGVAGDVVAVGDDLGRFQHRHVDAGDVVIQHGVPHPDDVHVRGLDEGDGLDPAADRDGHVVVDDLLGGRGDGHHAGGALPVQRHAGDGGRKARPQRGLSGDVRSLRALLEGGAHDDVIDLGRVDAGPLHRLGDGMSRQRLRLRIIERPPIGSADRRAGGGDDDGAAHGRFLPGLRLPCEWHRRGPRVIPDRH